MNRTTTTQAAQTKAAFATRTITAHRHGAPRRRHRNAPRHDPNQTDDIALRRVTTIALGAAVGANAVLQAAIGAPSTLTFDNATLSEIATMLALTATPIMLVACWLAAAIARPMRPIKTVKILLAGSGIGACVESVRIVTGQTHSVADQVVIIANQTRSANPTRGLTARTSTKSRTDMNNALTPCQHESDTQGDNT